MKNLILTILTSLALKYPAQTQTMEQRPYSILILMNATPQWLTLNRKVRAEFVEKSLLPLIEEVSKSVEVRFFDSEYFHAAISDFMLITTSNLSDYKLFIELLRDSEVYNIPYFDIMEIIVGQEQLFEVFNERLIQGNK